MCVKFDTAYYKLGPKSKNIVRDLIIAECGITRTSFHRKKKGVQAIRLLEIPVIEKHFRSRGVDPWTGDYL